MHVSDGYSTKSQIITFLHFNKMRKIFFNLLAKPCLLQLKAWIQMLWAKKEKKREQQLNPIIWKWERKTQISVNMKTPPGIECKKYNHSDRLFWKQQSKHQSKREKIIKMKKKKTFALLFNIISVIYFWLLSKNKKNLWLICSCKSNNIFALLYLF